MTQNKRLAGVLVSLLAFGASMAAFADSPGTPAESGKTPVNIKVSHGVNYDKANKAWIFIGDAQVTYKEDSITADRITLPDEGGYLIAEGNVVLKRDGQELRGQVINYNLDSREGKVIGATARVTGDGVKGHVTVRGAEISGSTDHYALTEGSITTCELVEPHYHLDAKSIEVWANERMVIKGLSYYEGRLRLFYWPYFVIPLKEENAFTLPSVGYSNADGVYVKTTYNYYRNEALKGKLHLDLFSKRGIGFGVDNSFKAKAMGSDGSVNAYVLGDPLKRKLTVTADAKYHQPLAWGWDSNTNLTGTGTIVPSLGLTDSTSSGLFTVRKKSDNYTGEMSLNVRRVDGTTDSLEKRAVTKHSYSLSRTTVLNVDGSFIEKEDTATKSASTYKVELKDTRPGRTLSLVTDRAFNRDSLSASGQTVTWNNLERLPEFTAQFTDIGLPKSLGGIRVPQVGATLVAGGYKENASSGPVEEGKAELQMGFRDYGVNLAKSLRMDLTGMVKGSAYTTEAKRLAVSSGVRLNQSLWGGSALRLGYAYEEAFGDASPFRFDAVTPSETVSGGVDLRMGIMKASVSGNYNFKAAVPLGDVVGSTEIKANDRVTISGEGRFNPNAMAWRQASATVRLKPSDAVNVDGTVKYDFEKHSFQTFDTKASLSLFKDLRLGYVGQYDNVLGKFTKNDVSVGYHNHCREFRLTYRQTDRTNPSVWLEYRLDAFPGADVRMGAGDGSGLVLDVNGLDNIIR